MVDATQAAGNRSSWGSRLGVLILGTALIAGATLYATAQFGWIDGEEFCPQTFQRRSFSYYELPLFGWQVSPVDRTATSGDLENYLVQQKFLSKGDRSDRWDLAWARRGNTTTVVGDAQIICRYLSALDDEEKQIWLEWTEENTEVAKLLWPQVARLAEMELYGLIPELFSIARRETDSTVFERISTDRLAARFSELAKTQQELQQHDLAVELFSEALTLSTNDLTALRGRALSFQELKKRELAEADHATIRRIETGEERG